MILPILTVWGMYKTYPEILDDIELPDGMDEDTMKDYIFMYAGDNEARYADPPLMERLVHRWFAGKKNDFQMMWNALHAEYNPIENTDRYEDFWENTDRTDNRTENNTVERNTSSDTTQSTDVTGESEGHGSTTGESTRTPNLTNEKTVSAFDSDDYQPSEKTTEGGSETTDSNESSESTSSSTQHSESTGNQTGKENETGKTVADNTMHNELKHGLHSHGNIGVTTNQQMINEELQLRVYDLYKTIALLFEDEFTVSVYERRCNEYGML